MRELWQPSETIISGIQAIELRTGCFGHLNVETCLASRKGEIWYISRGVWGAIIKPYRSGFLGANEHCIRFGDDELQGVIALLEIPLNPWDQALCANNFSPWARPSKRRRR